MNCRGRYSSTGLREIYLQEEIHAEKRLNRLMLPISVFFLVFSILLPIFNGGSITERSYISNILGAIIILAYQHINYILLSRNKYSWITKYITLFITISVITLVLFGYHYETDYIHSIRSATTTAYFMAIVLSGLYLNPKTSLFAGLVCILEYLLLYLFAFCKGIRITTDQETFTENILSADVLITYIIFLSGTGALMYINCLRQQKLMVELRDSSSKANFFENFDELTGLPNLKHFKERLNGQLIKAETRRQIFSVMCIGLDGFHSINQLYGHEKGNTILKKVGRRLKSTFREDDIISRFMGDRFLVIFTDLKTEMNVSDLIRKTKQAFEKPFRIQDTEIRITASTGLCTFPDDADTVDDLIKKAESAMYAAKHRGKDNYFLFNKTSQDILEQHLRIERQLEKAISNKEFRLEYQPKVTTNGRIVGLESLLRWENAETGYLKPDVFIPIAERSGMIIPIGYEVFRSCCRQLNNWKKKGIRNVRTTVNVSSVQFTKKDFVESILKIVQEESVDTSWLGIEITESGIIENETECIKKLSELKNAGFTISIDDFGKGYSSLSRLGNYPLDNLKIDKMFIDGLPESNVSTCLVRSIISLAKNLNYNVVAEGVENIEQIKFLVENGCTLFQGYYYYKPLPPEELESLLPRE